MELVWTCHYCKEPIGDDAGYLIAHRRQIEDYEASRADLDKGGELKTVGFVELLDQTSPADWRFIHTACDPVSGDDDIYVQMDRTRTLADLLEVVAHMLSKRTQRESTDIAGLVRRLSGVAEQQGV